MATAELPRPPLVRAPTTPDSTPPTMGQHERAQSQRLQAHARSGELSTSSWTRRLDLYLAQYDHEGDARARDAGYGADAAGGVGGRTPLGHIDNNRMRFSRSVSPSSWDPATPSTFAASPRSGGAPVETAAAAAAVTKDDLTRRRLNERLTSGLHFSSRASPSTRGNAGVGAAAAPPQASAPGTATFAVNTAGGGSSGSGVSDGAVYQPLSARGALFPPRDAHDAGVPARRRVRSTTTAGGAVAAGGDALTRMMTTTRARAGAGAGAGTTVDCTMPSAGLLDAISAPRRYAAARHQYPLAAAESAAARLRSTNHGHLPTPSSSPVKTRWARLPDAAPDEVDEDDDYGDEFRTGKGAAAATAATYAIPNRRSERSKPLVSPSSRLNQSQRLQFDSGDEYDEYADGAVDAAGMSSDDAEDPGVTPSAQRVAPYAMRLAAIRRQATSGGASAGGAMTAGGSSKSGHHEQAPDSPEAFHASRIDKLLEGLGAVLPTAGQALGSAGPVRGDDLDGSAFFSGSDAGNRAGAAKRSSRFGRLSPSSPPLRAVAAAAARGAAAAAAAAAGRPTETEAGFQRSAVTRKRVSGALQSLWREYQDGLGHLAEKSEEEVSKARNMLRFINDWIYCRPQLDRSGGSGGGGRKKKKHGGRRGAVSRVVGSGGLEGMSARARRRRRWQRQLQREEHAPDGGSGGAHGGGSGVDDPEPDPHSTWRLYSSDAGPGGVGGGGVGASTDGDYGSRTGGGSVSSMEGDTSRSHGGHGRVGEHGGVGHQVTHGHRGAGGETASFDRSVWHKQQERGDYYADRLVEEVRAQLTMLEQLKHRHSLPPSPPDSPHKSHRVGARGGGGGGSSGGGCDVVSGESNGGGKEGLASAARTDLKRQAESEAVMVHKTFATSGVQAEIPIKGPKVKNRGTNPHCDLLFPPRVATVATQCTPVKAAATAVQTDDPPSPTSVGCGPDHPPPNPVSRSCGSSRPISPVPLPPPVTVSAKTSTEVSIPFDAPEPLWGSTLEAGVHVYTMGTQSGAVGNIVAVPAYPVAQLAKNTLSVYPAPSVVDTTRGGCGEDTNAPTAAAAAAAAVANVHRRQHHRQNRSLDLDGDDSLSLSDSESETDDEERDNHGGGQDWYATGVGVGAGAGAGALRAPVFAPNLRAPVFAPNLIPATSLEARAGTDTRSVGRGASCGQSQSTPARHLGMGTWAEVPEHTPGQVPADVMSAAKVRQLYPELFRGVSRGEMSGAGGGRESRVGGGGGGGDDDDGADNDENVMYSGRGKVLIGRTYCEDD